MQIHTGEIIPDAEYQKLSEKARELYLRIEGTEEQAQTLSRRVKLGIKEEERRKARRKQQRDSRRSNR